MARMRQPQNKPLLGKSGMKMWRRYAPLLPNQATESDWDLLENYCLQFAMNQQSASEIQEQGSTVINGAGTRVQNPANAMFNATSKQIVVLAKELNLTALSQHRNQLESEEDDGFDA
ncbi:TPA: P27 family phage terminase small subunit [Vibrio parahaemolyticus]